MPTVCNPAVRQKVKKALLEGKDAKNALLLAGFSAGTAHNATKTEIVKSCFKEISADVKALTTVERVLDDLYRIEKLAIRKKDFSTAKECAVWRGKWLAMFTDKTEISESEKEDNQFSLQRLAKIRNLNGSKN